MPKRKKRRKRKPKSFKLSPAKVLAVSFALLLLLFLIFHRWRGGETERGAKIPPGSWRYGIDLSHNNAGPIVWDSLFVLTDVKGRTIRDHRNAREIKPISFVFIKATEGVSMKDSCFDERWKAAGATRLHRGAYHFFRSSKDPEAQARNFIRTVGKIRRSDLPPVLDIETIHRGCSDKTLNERALTWLEIVEKEYGRKPIIYTGASFAKNRLCKEIRERYPVWIAHYDKDSPAYDGWTWWQFTDKAIVMGVPGQVDLSVMRTD